MSTWSSPRADSRNLVPALWRGVSGAGGTGPPKDNAGGRYRNNNPIKSINITVTEALCFTDQYKHIPLGKQHQQELSMFFINLLSINRIKPLFEFGLEHY